MSIFSGIMRQAWNTFKSKLKLLEDYPLAMKEEQDYLEMKRIMGRERDLEDSENLNNEIYESANNLTTMNREILDDYKKLSNKLIKEYLKQNPPKATNLASRRL
jgi:hypothetical protein